GIYNVAAACCSAGERHGVIPCEIAGNRNLIIGVLLEKAVYRRGTRAEIEVLDAGDGPWLKCGVILKVNDDNDRLLYSQIGQLREPRNRTEQNTKCYKGTGDSQPNASKPIQIRTHD